MFIDFCQILYSLSHLSGRLDIHINKNVDEYNLAKRERDVHVCSEHAQQSICNMESKI